MDFKFSIRQSRSACVFIFFFYFFFVFGYAARAIYKQMLATSKWHEQITCERSGREWTGWLTGWLDSKKIIASSAAIYKTASTHSGGSTRTPMMWLDETSENLRGELTCCKRRLLKNAFNSMRALLSFNVAFSSSWLNPILFFCFRLSLSSCVCVCICLMFSHIHL